MAGGRISSLVQAINGKRKMPMSQGAVAKKSLGLLLCSVGGDKSQSPRNENHNLSSEEQIIRGISQITTKEFNDSSFVILVKRKSYFSGYSFVSHFDIKQNYISYERYYYSADYC
jgi:hypothetical protein